MNSEQAGKKSPQVPGGQAQQHLARSLTTGDVSDFLRDVARVLENPVTGNPPLGAALTRLAKALRRYSGHDVDEVLSGLTFRAGRRAAEKRGRVSQLQSLDVASLDLKTVRETLHSQALTKGDLVRIAAERFGIPKSRLARQNREAALDAIQAALRNAEALDIISQEARRVGRGQMPGTPETRPSPAELSRQPGEVSRDIVTMPRAK